MVELATTLLEHPGLMGSPLDTARLLPPRGAETPYLDGYAAAQAAARRAKALTRRPASPTSLFSVGAAGAGAGPEVGSEAELRAALAAAVRSMAAPPGPAGAAGGSAAAASGGGGAASSSGAAAAAAAAQDGGGAEEEEVPVGTAGEAVAVVWLRRAAKMGDSEASYHLAWMHQRGVGLPRDAARADKLLAK
jgi:TPR repeat protein